MNTKYAAGTMLWTGDTKMKNTHVLHVVYTSPVGLLEKNIPVIINSDGKWVDACLFYSQSHLPKSNLMKYKKGYLPTMISSSLVFFKRISPKTLYYISINFLQSTYYYLILISFVWINGCSLWMGTPFLLCASVLTTQDTTCHVTGHQYISV